MTAQSDQVEIDTWQYVITSNEAVDCRFLDRNMCIRAIAGDDSSYSNSLKLGAVSLQPQADQPVSVDTPPPIAPAEPADSQSNDGFQPPEPPPEDTSVPITYQPKGRDLTLTQNQAATQVGPISFTTNRGTDAISITTRANYADIRVWHYVISERYIDCPSLFETDLVTSSPHILRKGEIGKVNKRRAHMNVPAEFFDKSALRPRHRGQRRRGLQLPDSSYLTVMF